MAEKKRDYKSLNNFDFHSKILVAKANEIERENFAQMSSIKNDEKHTNESMSAYQMLGNHSFNNRELKSPMSLRKGQDFEQIEEEEQEVLDYTARKKPSYSISNPKKNFTHIQSNTTNYNYI